MSSVPQDLVRDAESKLGHFSVECTRRLEALARMGYPELREEDLSPFVPGEVVDRTRAPRKHTPPQVHMGFGTDAGSAIPPHYERMMTALEQAMSARGAVAHSPVEVRDAPKGAKGPGPKGEDR